MSEVLSRDHFELLSHFIYNELGIKLPDSKRTMLSGRLKKRLRHLHLNHFKDYCDYLFSPQGRKEEMPHFVNVVTTNKTDFFREPAHFDYLLQNVLPALPKDSAAPLQVWSAGCSTGEEPYTLAMVLAQALNEGSGQQFRILATDISTRVLDTAKKAIYPVEDIQPVPAGYKKKYLLKSRDKSKGLVRIVPELRKLVCFAQLNLMAEDYGLGVMLDIIFCRNVIIYFDKATQQKLMAKFCRCLKPGGYLFLGHSESLHGYDLPLVPVAPTVYRKISVDSFQ